MPARPIVDTSPIENAEALDRAVEAMEGVLERVLPTGEARAVLRGEPLGHPAHPMLTDLPIGFWTSAFVLDLLAPRSGRVAARRLVGWGVLSAVPTIATGWTDWFDMDSKEKRRLGVVHAATNAVATVLYAKSYFARRRGKHLRGVAWGLAGAGVATAGGYLGGHLAFGSSEPQPASGELPASTGSPARPGSTAAHAPAHAAADPVDPAGGSDDDRQPDDAGATGTLGDREAPVTELKPREAPPAGPGPTPARRHTG